ncbi:hypothetical protein ABCS02_31990 [Microbacterium sp. X-17]|uniref:hypothetical protein n=1 Tax=Microbacterium sp. X-17 TaxID=3144404 RepID=UPI0031F5168E
MTRRGLLALAAGLAAAAGLLAGCSAPGASDSGAAPTAPAASPTSTPVASASPQAAPTCATIITPTLADTFATQGWTFRQDPFIAGSQTIPGGLLCTWGDFSAASDRVQVFGWAPTTTAQQDAIRAGLLSQGWRLVDGAGSTYLTADPKTSISKDADGYGSTYEFGDGWVRFADTKQSLLLVEWPRS